MSTVSSSDATKFAQLLEAMSSSDPKTALQLSIDATQRAQAEAAKAAADYRAQNEIEFDSKGCIVKATLGGLYRLAQIYSQSQIVPKHYQNKAADCFIACQMSFRLKVDPLAYMQNSYIVHGRPGMEAKFATAMLNTSGLIEGRLRYRLEKDQAGRVIACTAIARDKSSGEDVSATVDMAMVQEEGWNKDKKNEQTGWVQKSKWNTMPEVMFTYRSATFLIRRFYSEVLMGMQLVDEIEDEVASGSNGSVSTTAAPNTNSRPMNLDAIAESLQSSRLVAENRDESDQSDIENIAQSVANGNSVVKSDGEIVQSSVASPAADSASSVAVPSGLESLREKIANYKQPARLHSLVSEIAADDTMSSEEKRIATGWAKDRLATLSGQLPLHG